MWLRDRIFVGSILSTKVLKQKNKQTKTGHWAYQITFHIQGLEVCGLKFVLVA